MVKLLFWVRDWFKIRVRVRDKTLIVSYSDSDDSGIVIHSICF